jgi:hypothetical protein
MGNRAKSLFQSFLFNILHPRTDLIALLSSNFVLKRYWRTQNFEISSPKGTSYTNSDSEKGNESNYFGVQNLNKYTKF